MISQGRFNNQSEVVREALRRMEREENGYLNPPPLTPAEIKECYGSGSSEEGREHALVLATQQSRKRRLREKTGTFEEL